MIPSFNGGMGGGGFKEFSEKWVPLQSCLSFQSRTLTKCKKFIYYGHDHANYLQNIDGYGAYVIPCGGLVPGCYNYAALRKIMIRLWS